MLGFRGEECLRLTNNLFSYMRYLCTIDISNRFHPHNHVVGFFFKKSLIMAY